MGFWRGVLEFFQDSDGRNSMTRLIIFFAFFVSTRLIFTIQSDSEKVNALYAYLGAFVLQYIGGKGADAWRGRGFADAPRINVQADKVNVPGIS